MNKKVVYKRISVSSVEVTPACPILGGSIVDDNTTVIIPRGQKVDEYDFSSSEFSHEWDVDEDPS